jgi:NDP-sugar pyrophosphorylase family protein
VIPVFMGETLPPLALLAGGLATRLLPVTAAIPKSMVEVAGEPFIAHQLRLLSHGGVRNVVICNGHLGEQIEAFVGNGRQFGCQVQYSRDAGQQLGTGGAVKRALALLGRQFMVMYGDSYLDAPFRPIYQAFCASNLPALITIYRNENRWDKSNIEVANNTICRYDKVNRTSSMLHIDYGIGVFDASVFEAWPSEVFDLADLYSRLAEARSLAGYEVHERFYEIGSPEGLAETSAMLTRSLRRPKEVDEGSCDDNN